MSHVPPTARNVVTCPFCKELIARGAVRCPHCQSNLIVPRRRKRRPFLIGNFMLGFYVATIIWILLIILYFSKS